MAMPAEIIEDLAMRDREPVFADRAEAGERLADLLAEYRGTDAIVLAIPSGGVPVGLAVAGRLTVFREVGGQRGKIVAAVQPVQDELDLLFGIRIVLCLAILRLRTR